MQYGIMYPIDNSFHLVSTSKRKTPTVKKTTTPAKAPVAPKKPKYPAPRVQREFTPPVKPLVKSNKDEIITAYGNLSVEFDNLAADLCIAGTKLDRALVDLKEAKAKIKELSK